MSNIRLFVGAGLKVGDNVTLCEEQSHYLTSVMRIKNGQKIKVFNGKDGEFVAEIKNVSKKSVEVEILEKTRAFEASKDIWLLFAPLKKDCTDFVIEKSTELGVAKIIPVITRNTISDKTKTERFKTQATEAAEQCRRLDVPEISDAIKLPDLLKNWDTKRKLYFMDESGQGETVSEVFKSAPTPAAILVGPEGGFTNEELDYLRGLSYTKGVSLGKLILRAETAVVAALSCWQSLSGEWR